MVGGKGDTLGVPRDCNAGGPAGWHRNGEKVETHKNLIRGTRHNVAPSHRFRQKQKWQESVPQFRQREGKAKQRRDKGKGREGTLGGGVRKTRARLWAEPATRWRPWSQTDGRGEEGTGGQGRGREEGVERLARPIKNQGSGPTERN
jgi:hypothetical protein